MTRLEVRRINVELQTFDGGTGEFEAVVCVYGVRDQYDTRFLPGCFADSLKRRLPDIRWGHQRERRGRIGEVVDYRDNPRQLEIIGQLDPAQTSEFVRRAWDGMRYGVLDEFSVGFKTLETRSGTDGIKEFVRCDLEEVSLVQEAAVPGAELLAVRVGYKRGPVAARLAFAERGSVAIAEADADAVLDRIARGDL